MIAPGPTAKCRRQTSLEIQVEISKSQNIFHCKYLLITYDWTKILFQHLQSTLLRWNPLQVTRIIKIWQNLCSLPSLQINNIIYKPQIVLQELRGSKGEKKKQSSKDMIFELNLGSWVDFWKMEGVILSFLEESKDTKKRWGSMRHIWRTSHLAGA